MKTIVIAGGGRHVGKTTLAEQLAQLLPRAKVVKIGQHPAHEDKPKLYFAQGTALAKLREHVGSCAYLIIESGAILNDPQLDPTLVIFLSQPQGKKDKESGRSVHRRADLVRGQLIARARSEELRQRLGTTDSLFAEILLAVGVTLEK